TAAGRAYIDLKSRRQLLAGQMRASRRVIELLEHSSGRVAFESSKFVLGVHGIAPPERANSVAVSLDVRAGYVIDLSGDPPGHPEPDRIAPTVLVDARPKADPKVVGPANNAIDHVPTSAVPVANEQARDGCGCNVGPRGSSAKR